MKRVIFCAAEDKPIPRSEFVKGFEYEKDRYVVIDDDDIKKIQPKTAKVMEAANGGNTPSVPVPQARRIPTPAASRALSRARTRWPGTHVRATRRGLEGAYTIGVEGRVMPVATALMTVDEFMDLPDPPGEFRLELRHGEVVELAHPSLDHDLQVSWIRDLLHPIAEQNGWLREEFRYRPTAEYNFRIADLGFATSERLYQIGDQRVFPGAPDLIVEVVSPSNRMEDMEEKLEISIANGCREFWLVFPTLHKVRVATVQGTTTYRQGALIPLTVFPGESVRVDEIFSQRIGRRV